MLGKIFKHLALLIMGVWLLFPYFFLFVYIFAVFVDAHDIISAIGAGLLPLLLYALSVRSAYWSLKKSEGFFVSGVISALGVLFCMMLYDSSWFFVIGHKEPEVVSVLDIIDVGRIIDALANRLPNFFLIFVLAPLISGGVFSVLGRSFRSKKSKESED